MKLLPNLATAALAPIFVACAAALGQTLPADATASDASSPIADTVTKIHDAPTDRISHSVSLGGTYTTPADLEGDHGHLAITRANVDVDFFIPASDKLLFTVGVNEELSWYDFGGAKNGVTQGIEKPASELDLVRVTGAARWKIDPDWTAFIGVFGQSAGAPDEHFGQTTTGGGFAGVRRKISDTFALTLGIAARSQLEHNASVLPLIGFEWDITDKLKLSLEGTGLELAWDVSNHWDLRAIASFQDRAYRLDQNGPLASGILRDRRALLGLQAEWTPAIWFSLRGDLGVVIWSQVEFDNSSGNKFDELNANPALYAGLTATFQF
jgi:hypothetical protein